MLDIDPKHLARIGAQLDEISAEKRRLREEVRQRTARLDILRDEARALVSDYCHASGWNEVSNHG